MRILKLFSIAAVLSLLMLQTASAQSPQLMNLTVTAWIDGRDFLYITPTAMHWHHLDYAAVGRLGGQNFPTALLMNRHGPSRLHISWIPDWPCAEWECRGEEVDSSTFVPAVPLPSQYQLTGFKLIRGRDRASVYQYPSAGNDYTTIIDFNDDPGGGADWYVVKLTFAAASGNADTMVGASPRQDVKDQSQVSSLAPEGLVTIYSNFGTGDKKYDCCTGLTTSGVASPIGMYVQIGNAFTPANDYTITEVQLAVGNATGTNAVTVGIWSDNNGVPGTLIRQWYPVQLAKDGTCCGIKTIKTRISVPVTAGTQYWFVVRQCVDSIDTWNAWNLNTTGSFGPSANKMANGHWTSQGTQKQGAFAIFGK